MASEPLIITPDHPCFEDLLVDLPFWWQQVAHATGGEYAFIAHAGAAGLLSPVPLDEANEYLWGGEYDVRLQEIGDDDDDY